MYNDACTIKYLKRRLIDGKFKVVKKFPNDTSEGRFWNSLEMRYNGPWSKAQTRQWQKQKREWEKEARKHALERINYDLSKKYPIFSAPSWDKL